MKKLLKFYSDEGPERVGFIYPKTKIVEVENIDTNANEGFRVSDEALMDAVENKAVATWHTHPGESSNLSIEDYTAFMMWPDLKHYIVGNDGVACFYIQDGYVMREDKNAR